ncbi:hypothetical protein [Psychrobacillus phage Perkons]|nr:hypothetical protein [Psychrobacillus phage Perkons]
MENLDRDFVSNVMHLNKNGLIDLYKELESKSRNAYAKEDLTLCKKLEEELNFVANKIVRFIIEEDNSYMNTTSELFTHKKINTTQKYIEENE